MTASPQPERIASLDGVRGLAILFVLVFHCLFIAPGFDLDPLTHPYACVAALGWAGVDVFFVLSGFLITGILVRSKGGPIGAYFRNFYMRRSLRIFPLYFLVMWLLLFVLDRPGAIGEEKLSYLLYYQNIRYACFGELVTDPARLITWSLAIEKQFYLVWPAIVWWLSERALRRVCAAMIVAAIVLRFVLLSQGFEDAHFLTPCRMDALAVGAWLAVSPPPRAWLGTAATLLGLGGLLATAYFSGSSLPDSPGQQQWGLIAALALGVGLLTLARSAPRLTPLFTWWPLRSLGKYSYCIYLTHYLVFDYYAWHVRDLKVSDPEILRGWIQDYGPLSMVLAFTTLCVATTWALAFISWHAFERWFLYLKRYFPSVSRQVLSEVSVRSGSRPRTAAH